jgi:hypothetical protein
MRIRLLAVGLITPLILGLSSVTGHAVPLPPYNAVFHSASLQAEPVAVRHRGTTVARGPRGGTVARHHRTVRAPVQCIPSLVPVFGPASVRCTRLSARGARGSVRRAITGVQVVPSLLVPRSAFLRRPRWAPMRV